MPRVDFYVLGETGTQVRHRYACRLTEKAFESGSRVYLRTPSAADSTALDELLWTFSDRTFLPHEIVTPASPTHPLIAALIGEGFAPEGYRSLLINVGGDIPADAEQCERIAEIIDADPERKQLGRDRFRQYRERGWTLESHNV